MENIRLKVQKLTDENDSLRRELRRSVDERFSGPHPDALLNINNDSISEIQRKNIELLEQEKNDAMRLYEQSRQIIMGLEEENNDLKNPLKPHLIKLDMQTKQVKGHFLLRTMVDLGIPIGTRGTCTGRRRTDTRNEYDSRRIDVRN